ncbi:MAG: VWA domain-containing protein [Lentisphaeraceae bacterium]|nr:VWA domain-containing protein [Lentisphaeraceae bacterium]
MTFLNPMAFYLLISIPFIVVWQRRRRQSEAIEYSSLSLFGKTKKTWRQRLLFLPQFLFLLALVSLIFALARPQVEVTSERQDRQGIAIQVLIDVSTSMDMYIRFKDENVTRMEVAKKVVEEFVAGDGEELKGRSNDLIGIVTFARYADTICPMTLGHDALVQMVRELTINERPNEDGTAYGDATALAAARLRSLEGEDNDIKSKIIVLLTDGENNCGEHMPLQAAGLAKKWGIRVYTISIKSGERVSLQKTDAGEFLVPPEPTASDKVLEQMAKETGGIYRTAYDFDSLKSVYKEIGDLEKTKMKAVNYTDYQESYASFAIAALILLLLQHICSATFLRVAP